jgi:hypothetical protein
MTMMDAALELAMNGWKVLPCHEGGPRAKAPRTEHGHLHASTDPKVIESWWSGWPRALIGAVVPDTLLVIDVDPRNGGSFAALQDVLGVLPPTLCVMSGRNDGGLHAYYLRPANVALVSTNLPTGVDLKLAGYCIMPPSVHPVSGQRYRWVLRPPVALPEAAITRLRAPARPPRRAAAAVSPGGLGRRAEALLRAVADAPEGRRNAVLYWAARCALDEGHDEALLDRLAAAAAEIGLDQREITRTITSATRGHSGRVAHV